MVPSERTRLVNRRRVLQSVRDASVVAAATALRGPLLAAGAPPRRDELVDVHVHLSQRWNRRGELTTAQLLKWMDAHRIAQAFVLPLVSPEAWFYPITADWVLEQTRPFRDRLMPFCAVDPRTGVYGGKQYFVDILSRYKEAGARGFGEHKWGGAIDDPKNIELMRACAEIGFVVLFHLDNQRNTDRPGLPGLERLIQAVPDVKLIGHGPGWWASISKAVTQADLGGYPKGPIVAGGAVDRLMEKYPQLYADLSAGSGHNALRRDLKFGREFLLRHANQILFGSDYLADGQEVPQFDLFDGIELADDVREKIFCSNARRLVNL